MFKHKVGDIIRIRSQKWIDVHEKEDVDGVLAICKDGCEPFSENMFIYAGKTAKIVRTAGGYVLDIDRGKYVWEDWMFDSDCPDDPLYPYEAIREMLDEKTLYDKDNNSYTFNKQKSRFECLDRKDGHLGLVDTFTGLFRRPAKRKRPMTRWEMLAWANSEESRGWVVKTNGDIAWYPPQFYGYTGLLTEFQRARLLPDLSGIDESTVEGFEVEE
jgi:hypothetical protein